MMMMVVVAMITSRYSEATTLGIRVQSSSVFAPEMGRVIYSIRILLLSPGEEGAVDAATRGFHTAQLHSRHWIVTSPDGQQEHVKGDGVVGKYPLLREGGFRDDEQSRGAGPALRMNR